MFLNAPNELNVELVAGSMSDNCANQWFAEKIEIAQKV